MAKSAETDQAPPAEGERPRSQLELEPFATHFVFDNPSFGRALRYTFGEKRLGRAVFMNAIILVIALFVVQELWSRGGLGFISEKLPFGRAAFIAVAIVETLVVSLLGPISFTHLFNAERREDCFDQVVASGCSPLRILLGRYAAMLAFVTVVALSALPFFVFSASVLRGAGFADIATFYVVLEVYAAGLGAAVLATTVAIEDAAFPAVLAFVASASAVVPAFARYVPPAVNAWSPVRHITVQLSDVSRGLGLGDLSPPMLFGVTFPTALFSCFLYFVLGALSLAYVCVGPDLELAEGLDSFSSVTLKRGGEASRGRRGLAATLLRAVQLRFFYENLGKTVRAWGPFLRLAATFLLYAGGHVFMLGMVWPKVSPRSWNELEAKTLDPYLAFTAISLGLMALASSGARAAVLARVPVLSLGRLKIGRFPMLFLLVAAAIALPALLFGTAAHRAELPLDDPRATRALALFGVVALYAAFMFALALVWAMVTTNPYSAMGSTLFCLVVANLLPLGWVPLYASVPDLVDEKSAHVLDASPIFAGWSIYDPTDEVPFATVRDQKTVTYQHKPGWRPFVWVHGPLALALLAAGLALERRDAKKRRFLGALGIVGALAIGLAPGEARAQDAPAPVEGPVKVEVVSGLGGKVPIEGFTPLEAILENAGDRAFDVLITVKDPGTGAVLATLPRTALPKGEGKTRVLGLAPAEPVHDASALLIEATDAASGALITRTKAKVDPLPRTDKLLVVLDRRGALPFAATSGIKSTEPPLPPRVPRRRAVGGDTTSWTPSFVVRVEDLPQSALGWSGAGAVLVGDLELDQLGTAAARALKGWLVRGGEVVIAVGERAKLLRSSKCELGQELADALDGLPDVPPRREVPLAALLPGASPAVAAQLASAVALLAPTPRDRVLARGADGEPLAIRRTCGLGTLTILAYDPWQPPLLHEDATEHLLESALVRPHEAAAIDAVFQELSQLRVQPAKIGPAFALLLLYALLIGPGVYFALRPKRRGVLAWLLMPATAIVVAALTPLYKIVLARTESAIVSGSVLETSAGDPWEVEVADAHVFSGGAERHELSVPGDDVTAATLVARGFRTSAPRLGEPLGLGGMRSVPGGRTSLAFTLDVPLWGSRHVLAESVTHRKPPRIAGRVALRAGGTFVEIENDGRDALEDAVVVYPEFRAQPGLVQHDLAATLAPGGKVAVLVTQGNLTNPTPADHSKDLSETLEHRLLEGLAPSLVEAAAARVAVLVARFGDREPLIEAGSNVRVRASGTVLVARLPFAFEERVPFGVSSIEREEHEAAPVGSGTPGRTPWVAVTRIHLPPGAGTGAAPAKVRLDIQAGNRVQDLHLALREAASGAWVPLELDQLAIESDGSVPGAVVTLPGGARFVDPLEGTVAVRQQLEVPTGARHEGLVVDVDASVEWAAAKAR